MTLLRERGAHLARTLEVHGLLGRPPGRVQAELPERLPGGLVDRERV